MTGDVARTARFYRELFGTTSEGDEFHTTMDIGGLGLAIWRQNIPDGLSTEQMQEIRKHCYALMLSSPDVDNTYLLAKELGAAILEEPADQPWGVRAFVMTDPDGNRIDVFGKP